MKIPTHVLMSQLRIAAPRREVGWIAQIVWTRIAKPQALQNGTNRKGRVMLDST